MKIAAVVGARPNFVKIAPIMAALKDRSEARTTLIHTGQHYDVRMSEAFFANLEIPAPDINLDVRSGTAAAQIAEVMQRLEPVRHFVGAHRGCARREPSRSGAGSRRRPRDHIGR